MISFEPLWETIAKKNITIYRLINHYGLSRGTLDSLKHNRNVTLNTVNWLCEILQCDITDVVKYVPNNNSVEISSDITKSEEIENKIFRSIENEK